MRRGPIRATTAVALLLTGCGATQRPVAPNELESVARDRGLLVETRNGVQVELTEVSLRGDTLRGIRQNGLLRSIPYDSIQAVRLHQPDRTAALVFVPAAAVAAWLLVAGSSAPSPPPSTSSCPFIYAHDGRELVFQAEPYGGAIVPALKRTEWTPLPALREVDGAYRIRIANEMDETQYVDEASLLVVDHPQGTRVAADAYGEVHVFGAPAPPAGAVDARGRDLRSALRAQDGDAWASSYEEMDGPARESLRDPLLLEFPKPAEARTARLLVEGATTVWGAQVAREFLALRGTGLPDWYRELSEDDAALEELTDWFAREGLYVLPIEVETPDGWEAREALYGSGPFAWKATAYTLDVSDIPGTVLRVRLSVPVNFWALDAVAAEFAEPPAFHALEVEASTVRDPRGRDTGALLRHTDDRALVMSEIGDYVDLVYPAPAPRPGWDRTVLLKISGHYDIHLAGSSAPQEALLRRIIEEPGYTLRFAYDRYRAATEDAFADGRR